MAEASRAIKTIFSLINNSIGQTFDPEDFVLSLPQFVVGDLNTKISIKPKINKGLYGNFDFFYNRVTLQDVEESQVTLANATNLHQLFEQLNAEPFYFLEIKRPGESESFKIPGRLFEEEFINLAIPPMQMNQSIVMNLKPIQNSYLFTGLTTVKISKIP